MSDTDLVLLGQWNQAGYSGGGN